MISLSSLFEHAKNTIYDRLATGSVPQSLQKILGENVIYASEFGVSVDATAIANSNALNAAIDYAQSVGGATISLPYGTIQCGEIQLKSGVYLRGHGDRTILRVPNGFNDDYITWPSTSKIEESGLLDLQIDGNRANNTAGVGAIVRLYQDVYSAGPVNGNTNYDAQMLFSNLLIENCAGDGFFIDGAGTQTNPFNGQPLYYNLRGLTFNKVVVGWCSGHGMDARKLSDSNLGVGTIFKVCSLAGLKVRDGANLQMIGVKTFYNNRFDPGVLTAGTTFINSRRLSFVATETQEEFTNGFLFDNCQDVIVNIRADGNGASPAQPANTNLGNGVVFVNGCNTVVGQISCNSFAAGRAVQQWGVRVDSTGLPNSSLDVVAVDQAQANYVNDGFNNSPGLRVEINGIIQNSFTVRAANTYTTFFQQDGGTGSDSLLRIDCFPATPSSEIAVDWFRNSITSGTASFKVFVPGTNILNGVFSGRGVSFLGLNNGNVGIGVAPSTTGSKFQIVGGVMVSNALSTAVVPAGQVRAIAFSAAATNTSTVFFQQDAGVGGTDSLLDINPSPQDGTSQALVRMFRGTNTTGNRFLQLCRGDGTNTVTLALDAGKGLAVFVPQTTAQLQALTGVQNGSIGYCSDAKPAGQGAGGGTGALVVSDGSGFSNLAIEDAAAQVSTATGATLTIGDRVATVLIDPSTAIAALTITMPLVPPTNTLRIHFGGAIAANLTVVTALTIVPSAGQSIYQNLTPVTAKGGDCLVYELIGNQWRRIV